MRIISRSALRVYWHKAEGVSKTGMDPLLWLALAAIVAVILIVLSLKTLRGRKKKHGQFNLTFVGARQLEIIVVRMITRCRFADAEPVVAEGEEQREIAVGDGQQRRVRNLRARAAFLRRARAGAAGEGVGEGEEGTHT